MYAIETINLTKKFKEKGCDIDFVVVPKRLYPESHPYKQPLCPIKQPVLYLLKNGDLL